MRSAIRIGLSIAEFEDMTPYQLNLFIEAYAEREEKKISDIYLASAWTSRWVWSKKIPKFDEIINKVKEKTPNQMLEEVKKLNALFGGTIRIEERG